MNIILLGIMGQKLLFLYKFYACICLIYKDSCLNLLNGCFHSISPLLLLVLAVRIYTLVKLLC